MINHLQSISIKLLKLLLVYREAHFLDSLLDDGESGVNPFCVRFQMFGQRSCNLPATCFALQIRTMLRHITVVGRYGTPPIRSTSQFTRLPSPRFMSIANSPASSKGHISKAVPFCFPSRRSISISSASSLRINHSSSLRFISSGYLRPPTSFDSPSRFLYLLAIGAVTGLLVFLGASSESKDTDEDVPELELLPMPEEYVHPYTLVTVFFSRTSDPFLALCAVQNPLALIYVLNLN